MYMLEVDSQTVHHSAHAFIIKGRLVEQLRSSEVSAPPHLTAHHHISLSTSRHITSHHISLHISRHITTSLSVHLTAPHHIWPDHITTTTTSPHHHITTSPPPPLQGDFSWQAQDLVKLEWCLGATVGAVGVSLFVASATCREKMADSRNAKRCIFQYNICVSKARKNNLGEPAGARWQAQGINLVFLRHSVAAWMLHQFPTSHLAALHIFLFLVHTH